MADSDSTDLDAIWVALWEHLGGQSADAAAAGKRWPESLMMAAARVYSTATADAAQRTVAIAVLRSAGYSGAEMWERLRRARELIPRPLRSV